MPFDKARTSLNDIEERIRRFFGAAGTIGLEFQPKLDSVALAGDLYSPGNSSFRGRRWSATDTEATAANWVMGIQARVPVVVTEFRMAASTAGAARLYLNGPATSNLTFDTIAGVTWQESPTASDLPPILQTPAGVGLVPTGGSFLEYLYCPANSRPVISSLGVYLPAGASLVVLNAAISGTVYATFRGYVY